MTERVEALLDTDTLSAMMKADPRVVPAASEYVEQHGGFTFSVITRYEILRGLFWKNAHTQAEAFDRFCSHSRVLFLTDETIVRAAQLYATLRQTGGTIGDADLLIAATALVNGLAVVTGNHKHFSRVPGLRVETWLDSRV